jgi:hypothetical protein
MYVIAPFWATLATLEVPPVAGSRADRTGGTSKVPLTVATAEIIAKLFTVADVFVVTFESPPSLPVVVPPGTCTTGVAVSEKSDSLRESPTIGVIALTVSLTD